MKCYGLIGYPLTHSFSEKYFTEKFKQSGITDTTYKLYPIDSIEQLPQLINSNKHMLGLNVTIPYKEKVIPYLDTLDDPIAEIGAVNTIRIYREGHSLLMKGFNTDVYGFAESLRPHIKKGAPKNALILGSGGASKAVNYVLKMWGFKITCVSRSPAGAGQIGYRELTPQLIKEAQVIVNTSPVGMHPNTDQCPDIPYESVNKSNILFDLIYNPQVTKFMQMGLNKGATVVNGLEMLHRQADKAWEIWNNENILQEIKMP